MISARGSSGGETPVGASSGIYLTVVIPAHNEAGRIRSTLQRVREYLSNEPWRSEVIVFLDGCRDGTSEVVHDELDGHPDTKILESASNRGKGYAVRAGMLAARGQFVVFSDADLSTPIEEVERLIDVLNDGNDVAIGSRALAGSDIRISQPRWRQELGRMFNRLVRCFFISSIRDTQCGFKCFPGDVAQRIFSRQRIDGFGFDVEVVWIARKLGYRVTEVPVVWSNHPVSSVHPVRDSLAMLLHLVAIRYNDLRGRYGD